MRGNRTEAPIPALRRDRGVLLSRHKTHVVEFERLEVDRFLNQIAVFIADVLELRATERARIASARQHGCTGWA